MKIADQIIKIQNIILPELKSLLKSGKDFDITISGNCSSVRKITELVWENTDRKILAKELWQKEN
jgi:hypothetical protein